MEENSDSETSKKEHKCNLLEGASQDETEEPSKEPSAGAICQFFLAGNCRFGDKCRNSHTGSAEVSAHLPAVKNKTGKGKSPSEPNGKKPPMKTASDVISRIQWDNNLPKEHFSVGYLDRFLGVIEKPFSIFCWEDLASTGVDVLAIPRHRIQYFKYGDSVVWDKASRTDNVFGSTGSGLTILDVIAQLETQAQAEGNDGEEMEEATPEEVDDEDDACDQRYSDLERERRKKVRPTHFIAVRISSEEVRTSAKEIQDVLIKYNADMAEFLTPLPELHLTLCLLYLDTANEIEIAHNVLHETKTEIQRLLPPSLILSFDGLKDFHSRVLYLAPTSVPGLPSFVNTLSHNFRSRGLVVIDPPTSNSFHLTVAKVPRNVASKNPKLLFLPEVYNSGRMTHFGAQHIDHLSFCYAGSSRRTDGFYTTLLELPLY